MLQTVDKFWSHFILKDFDLLSFDTQFTRKLYLYALSGMKHQRKEAFWLQILSFSFSFRMGGCPVSNMKALSGNCFASCRWAVAMAMAMAMAD